MAAADTDHTAPLANRHPHPSGALELEQRLREEVSRAERQGTALSCLHVSLREPAGAAREHGAQLPEQALDYISQTLGRQLRRFDRIGRLPQGQLLILLPGADDRSGEIVARRTLGRLRAVKLEHGGARRPIGVQIGLAAWHEGISAEQLVEQSRLAAYPATPAASRTG